MTKPNNPARLFFYSGALLGALTVIAGAFGAHALDSLLEPHLMKTFEKAVDYQGLHALLLIFIGFMGTEHTNLWLHRAGWFALAGILLFSGSLYLLVWSGVKLLGLITPFGGTSFVLAWLCLAKSWPEIRS